MPTITINSHEAEYQRVPQDEGTRNAVRALIRVKAVDSAWNRQSLEERSAEILKTLAFPLDYIAWTMTQLGSEYWRKRIETIPFSRRLLLLPHCMRDKNGCPAVFDADGLHCQNCGNCELGKLSQYAKKLGYHVVIAEGTPIVLKWILSGKADAILGVGCLSSLEKAFDKLQLAGIPAMAVPLFECRCVDSKTDIEHILEMLETPFSPTEQPFPQKDTYIHLLRAASKLFEPEVFNKRMTEALNLSSADDSTAKTQRLAFDFVSRGGKFLRPFIALATYDAMNGSSALLANGESVINEFPESIFRVALAIEIFHKASLIHDDIEDEDAFRYGLPTLHKEHGVPTAINLGDYLIGIGYRLLASCTSDATALCDIFSKMAAAHTALAQGQGADLFGRNARLTPLNVLEIYALKTSPAFEAALYAGLRLAVSKEETFCYEAVVSRFSKLFGVAFQIKNDLSDWKKDESNKREIGTDVLYSRPTILRAFALEMNLEQETHETYGKHGIFEKTQRLLMKYMQRTRDAAKSVSHPGLQKLLFHFLDSFL